MDSSLVHLVLKYMLMRAEEIYKGRTGLYISISIHQLNFIKYPTCCAIHTKCFSHSLEFLVRMM